MAADRSEIRTKFVLDGLAKAANGIRSFVSTFRVGMQSAEKDAAGVTTEVDKAALALREFVASQRAAAAAGGAAGKAGKGYRLLGMQIQRVGFESHRVFKIFGVEVKTVGALGAGLAKTYQGVAWAIKTAFDGVIGTLRFVRTTATSVFSSITAAADRMSLSIRGSFQFLRGEMSSLLGKTLISQIGSSVIGGPAGIGLKFTLGKGVISTMLAGFRRVATGFKGMLDRVLDTVFNPRRMLRIASMVRRVAMVASAPTGAVIAGVHSGANEIKDQVSDNIEKTGTKSAGFNVTEASQLKSFFGFVGGSAEDATTAMEKFAEASKDISEKGADSDFAKSLQAAGVAFQDLNGQARSGAAIFHDLWQTWRQGDDPFNPGRFAAADAAIRQIIGDSRSIVPLFDLMNRTSGPLGDLGLRDFSQQADRFGTVIGPRQIASMREYQYGLGALKEAFRGLKIALATEIGPTIGAWFGALGNWIARNRDTIVGFARRLVNSMILFSTELMIVATQSKAQFAGYDFKNSWLVTARDLVSTVWGYLRGFASFITSIMPSVVDVLTRVYGAVAPYGDTIAAKVSSGISWIGRLIAAVYHLSTIGQVDPGFEWLTTVSGYLRGAWRLVSDLGRGIDGLASKLRRSPEAGGIYESLKNGLAQARDYAVDLGRNVYTWLHGRELEKGFGWIDTVGSAFKTLGGWISLAGSEFLNFVNVVAGKREALDASPQLAKLRSTIVDDYWPRLKKFADGAWQFIIAMGPPVFSTIAGIIETLKPYLDGMGGALKSAGDYTINIVENVAKYFAGQDLAKGFEWVGGTLDKVKALAIAFKDVASWIADAGKALALHWSGGAKSDGDQQVLDRFKWLTRLTDAIGAIRGFFSTVSGTIEKWTGAGAGTQGLIGFISLLLIPRLRKLGETFAWVTGLAGRFVGSIGRVLGAPSATAGGVGVAEAAVAAGALAGAPGKAATAARAAGVVSGPAATAGARVVETAVAGSALPAALAGAATVIGALSRLAVWGTVAVVLGDLVLEVTGLKDKIKGFFGAAPGTTPTSPAADTWIQRHNRDIADARKRDEDTQRALRNPETYEKLGNWETLPDGTSPIDMNNEHETREELIARTNRFKKTYYGIDVGPVGDDGFTDEQRRTLDLNPTAWRRPGQTLDKLPQAPSLVPGQPLYNAFSEKRALESAANVPPPVVGAIGRIADALDRKTPAQINIDGVGQIPALVDDDVLRRLQQEARRRNSASIAPVPVLPGVTQ